MGVVSRFIRAAVIAGVGEHKIKNKNTHARTAEIKDNVLTVSGERRSEHEEKQEGLHRIERSYGSFSRSLTLPRGVDAEAVTAGFDKGVLEVRIPKPVEAKPHKVAIEGEAIEGEATDTGEGGKEVYGS
mgnify:CR=1 FL=1